MHTSLSPKQEILALLLADMRSRRLIIGMEQTGLYTDHFYSDLTELILQKMGFEDYTNDRLAAWYEETLEELVDMEIGYFIEKQRELAAQLYEKLVWRRLLE